MARSSAVDRCRETIIDEDKVEQAQQVLLAGLAATRLADTFKLCPIPPRPHYFHPAPD
jgi:hypothetical protein